MLDCHFGFSNQAVKILMNTDDTIVDAVVETTPEVEVEATVEVTEPVEAEVTPAA